MATIVERLDALPTLAVGQAANLKLDTGTTRVWLSRCGVEDGETQPIQLETLRNGRWEDSTPRSQSNAEGVAAWILQEYGPKGR